MITKIKSLGGIGFLLIIGMIINTPWSSTYAEVLQLKNGVFIEGKVKELKEDRVVLTIPEGERIIFFSDLTPLSVYRLRIGQIDPADPKAHLALGEYCLEHKLYPQAKKEWEEALALDESLKEELTKKIEELIHQESREVIDQAYALMKEDKYEEALSQLQALLDRYPQSPLVDEAREAALFASVVLRDQIDKERRLKEMLDTQKRQEKLARAEAALRDRFTEALDLFEAARKLNRTGLNYEAEFKMNQANKSYQQAVEKLISAQKTLEKVLGQTKDVDLITVGKEKIAEMDRWLVIVYNNLGQLWAYQLQFREALKWLNQALALEPDNQTALKLKLDIIDIEARRRIPESND